MPVPPHFIRIILPPPVWYNSLSEMGFLNDVKFSHVGNSVLHFSVNISVTSECIAAGFNIMFSSKEACYMNYDLRKVRRVAGVDPASNRNDTRNISWRGDKGCRYVGLATLPPSRADCLEIWESQPPWTLKACPGLERDCFTLLCLCVGLS
jgi:hypothetical protein